MEVNASKTTITTKSNTEKTIIGIEKSPTKIMMEKKNLDESSASDMISMHMSIHSIYKLQSQFSYKI